MQIKRSSASSKLSCVAKAFLKSVSPSEAVRLVSSWPIFLVTALVSIMLLSLPTKAGTPDLITAKQMGTIDSQQPDSLDSMLKAHDRLWNHDLQWRGQAVALLQFDPAEIPQGVPVKSARLKMKLYDPRGDRAARPAFNIYPVISEWDASSTTWNTKPQWDDAFSDCQFQPREIAEGEFETFDVTAIVSKWIDGSVPNHGLAIVADQEQGNWSQIIYFNSPAPVLELEY